MVKSAPREQHADKQHATSSGHPNTLSSGVWQCFNLLFCHEQVHEVHTAHDFAYSIPIHRVCCVYLVFHVCVGAVALSTGNTIGGATSNRSTSPSFTSPTGGGTSATPPVPDVHLRSVCAASAPNTAMANQSLFDLSALEFDLTPAVSGPLVFSYVFGSEEYFNYSPGGGEGPAWHSTQPLPPITPSAGKGRLLPNESPSLPHHCMQLHAA
jgi:hypothetical protein